MSLLERDRGSYLFSCDRCGSVTREVVSVYFRERGEHVDLCGKCLKREPRSAERLRYAPEVMC
jgi:hypothetical protein